MQLKKLNDDRVLRTAGQFIFALLVIFVVASMYGNTITALTKRGMLPSFKFLSLSAGIDIGEHIIPFNNSSSNFRAIIVGLLNTITISIVVIFISTFMGLFIGLCRLSKNWLVRNIALAYIELIRNIPLLVLLLFWYRAVFMELPHIKKAVILGEFQTSTGNSGGSLFISNRGLSIAWLKPAEGWIPFLYVLIGAFILSTIFAYFLKHHGMKTGRKPMTFFWSMIFITILSAVGWILIPGSPMIMDYPVLDGFNASGGLSISSEWGSLFSGLILYTSAYVAEAVRAGIQGVDRGQVEAAHSLGLNHFQTTRLVVLPQALRITIPPLTSIYLGVAKNTSLGVAIGFPDLFSVIGTLLNQTGRALELILVVMIIYLGLSLITSLIMNIYNKKIQLEEK
jgi:general L-amino acid transport system permease protein